MRVTRLLPAAAVLLAVPFLPATAAPAPAPVTGPPSASSAPVDPMPPGDGGRVLVDDIVRPADRSGVAARIRKWPGKVIPYYESIPAKWDWSLDEAIAHWNGSGAKIKFVEVPRRKAKLVISYGDTGGADGVGTLGYQYRNYVHLSPAYKKADEHNAETRVWVGRLFAHELGHVLGFDHTTGQCSLMYPVYNFGVCETLPIDKPGYYNCRWIDKKLLRRFTQMYGGKPKRPAKVCLIEALPGELRSVTFTGGNTQNKPVKVTWLPPGRSATGPRSTSPSGRAHPAPPRRTTGSDASMWTRRPGPGRIRRSGRALVLPGPDREPVRRDPAADGHGRCPLRAGAGGAGRRHPGVATAGRWLALHVDDPRWPGWTWSSMQEHDQPGQCVPAFDESTPNTEEGEREPPGSCTRSPRRVPEAVRGDGMGHCQPRHPGAPWWSPSEPQPPRPRDRVDLGPRTPTASCSAGPHPTTSPRSAPCGTSTTRTPAPRRTTRTRPTGSARTSPPTSGCCRPTRERVRQPVRRHQLGDGQPTHADHTQVPAPTATPTVGHNGPLAEDPS